MRHSTFALLLLATLCWSGDALGQRMHGSLTSQDTGERVTGAIVLLLDLDGSRADATLSDSEGAFELSAPGTGSYRVRVERIGFRTGEFGPFILTAGEMTRQVMRLPVEPVLLSGIVVQTRRACRSRDDPAVGVASVWSEARKALEAMALAERRGLVNMRVRRYVRVQEVGSNRVSRETPAERMVTTSRPFASLRVDSLLNAGFVQRSGGVDNYFAPDAQALLSDEFLSEYCFEVRRSGLAPRSIGLGFWPRSPTGPAAIQGTMWLDIETRGLRAIDYTYDRIELPYANPEVVGGRIEFATLPDGVWFIRRWYIRMPALARRSATLSGAGQPLLPSLTELTEEGGEVLSVAVNGGPPVQIGQWGRLVGRARTGDGGDPSSLAGATVALSGTAYSTVVDEAGAFQIDQLFPGRYAVVLLHPRLARFGLHAAEGEVTIAAGETAALELTMPEHAEREAMRRFCSSAEGREHPMDFVVVGGRVLEEGSGAPVTGAEVRLTWERYAAADGAAGSEMGLRAVRMVVGGTTDEEGYFLVCSVASDRSVSAEVRHEARPAVAQPLTVPTGTDVLQHTFIVPGR